MDSLSFQTSGDALSSLRSDLEQRGGTRLVWGVLREDAYETLFGDGYYAYLEAAFSTEQEAIIFAAGNKEASIIWHIRGYELHLIGEDVAVIRSGEPNTRHPWVPGTSTFVPSAKHESVSLDDLLICLINNQGKMPDE